jgi:hypothetical protein
VSQLLSTATRAEPALPKLSPPDVHALNAAAFAGYEFEPFVSWIIAADVLDRVVRSGLVESGKSCRPAVGSVGYRLTPQGWAVFHDEQPKRKVAQGT